MIPARQIAAWLGPRDRIGLALAAVVGAGLGAWALGPEAAGFTGLLAAGCLAVLLIDGRHYVIPDLISLPLAGLGLGWSWVAGRALLPQGIAMALMALALVALRAAASRVRGRTALGLGDVKLLVAAAAWLPADQLPIYVFAAALSGLAEALLRRLGDPVRGQEARIAFGRHLAPWLVLMVLIQPMGGIS